MAVVKDALGTELIQTGVASTPFNYTNLTVVSNTNGAIVVTFVIDLNGNATSNFISTVTGYTKINSVQSSGNEHRTELWAKVGNSTGAQTIVITPSSTWIATSNVCVSAISVTGADQTGGSTTFNNAAINTGTSANSTISVTTTSTGLALAVAACNNEASAMTKTAIYTFDTGSFSSNGAAYDQGNASSPSVFATTGGTTSVNWDTCGTNIKAVSSSNVGPQPHFIFTPGRGPRKGLSGQLNTQTVITVQGPFNQYDWPNPVPPKQIDQFWANDLLPLLFTGSRPHPNYDWPNPPRVTWYQHWQQGPQQSRPVTFNNLDWPNPPPVQWYREWSGVNAMRMAQQPASFFNNQDWPNPPPVIWYREFAGVNAQRMAQQPASFFNNQDWPNPPPVIWYRDFSLNLLQTTLKPAQQNPFVQSDWPNPPPVLWYREFTGDNARRMSQQPASYFNNQDWPNPPPVKWYKDYSFSNLQVIANQPASYFNNQDWPNPLPLNWFRDFYSSLVQQMPVQRPFNQSNWPNIPGPMPIDQFWFNNLVALLSQPNPVPFNQMYWPLPIGPAPIDQFYSQSLANILPTPPPPPENLFGGHQWTEADVKRAAAQWLAVMRWYPGIRR